jgi:hypothetical protein
MVSFSSCLSSLASSLSWTLNQFIWLGSSKKRDQVSFSSLLVFIKNPSSSLSYRRKASVHRAGQANAVGSVGRKAAGGLNKLGSSYCWPKIHSHIQ